MPAIVLRHVQEPQPELLRLGLERNADIRLEVRPVHRRHLDRNELAIDEFADRVLEQAYFLGQFEIHLLILPGAVACIAIIIGGDFPA